MASIQQLERLHQIQRLFYVADSLESVVAGERVSQLINRTEQLIKRRATLRDERRRLRIATELLDERKRAVTYMNREDWLSNSILTVLKTKDMDSDLKQDEKKQKETNKSEEAKHESINESEKAIDPKDNSDLDNKSTQKGDIYTAKEEEHVLINIGGLMFEVRSSVLKRDKKSLLCQLTLPNPPVIPDKNGGFFYFERDWWLFRYVVNFLRDGTLPDDRNLLAQLYREASWWQLMEMQKAIEERKLHLVGDVKEEKKEEQDKWWRKQPNWWQAVDREKIEKEAREKEKKDLGLWMGTAYGGKDFLPLSSDPEKVVTEFGKKDAIPVVNLSHYETEKIADPYAFGGYRYAKY